MESIEFEEILSLSDVDDSEGDTVSENSDNEDLAEEDSDDQDLGWDLDSQDVDGEDTEEEDTTYIFSVEGDER